MKTGSRQLDYAIHVYVSHGFAALAELIQRFIKERGRQQCVFIPMCKMVMKRAGEIA